MLSGSNSQIHLIMFTSEYTGSSLTLSVDLSEMIEANRERNAAENVTGVLFYQNSRFVGLLEGNRQILKSRLEEMTMDRRHHDLRVLFDDPIDERGFSDWSLDCLCPNPDARLSLETLESLRDAYRRNFTPSSLLLVSVLKDFVEQTPLREFVSHQE